MDEPTFPYAVENRAFAPSTRSRPSRRRLAICQAILGLCRLRQARRARVLLADAAVEDHDLLARGEVAALPEHADRREGGPALGRDVGAHQPAGEPLRLGQG